ncbi:ribosomal-processing cysteine protease Prp [Agrilactobacillus fermenti]|uniref:ribosomal-processing cysteine protease Prp n=1 Tax=Agrilactobacillus fermenti TaxID=2586909 RepID=UPI001E367963|nr:ribosomal-processing cysteine protease Prp [Agrilactobacillus fermenti]MCD2256202.1 ribosomal-processing cysteine protease Prp [Agrilactobacillus fermenti]
MIQANFYRDEQGYISHFRITGHADSGVYGHDIVCAAVSATAIGTVNSLQTLAGLKPKIAADQQNGGLLDVNINLDTNNDKRLISQVLLENLYGTLKSIETNYGDYISLNNDSQQEKIRG